MSTAALYEVDFAEWAVNNAQLLRSGRLAEADLENIAEEIEDVGRRHHDALEHRLERLMQHLLKWQFQPERRSGCWKRTIHEQRRAIKKLLKKYPSLRHGLNVKVAEAYEEAAHRAYDETIAAGIRFPESNPYSLEQLLDDKFQP